VNRTHTRRYKHPDHFGSTHIRSRCAADK